MTFWIINLSETSTSFFDRCAIYKLPDAHKHITQPPPGVIFPKKVCGCFKPFSFLLIVSISIFINPWTAICHLSNHDLSLCAVSFCLVFSSRQSYLGLANLFFPSIVQYNTFPLKNSYLNWHFLTNTFVCMVNYLWKCTGEYLGSAMIFIWISLANY